MNEKDGEIKKNNKIEQTTNKFNFIEKTLKEKVGNVVDEFLALNNGNRLNKYITNSFVHAIVAAIKESEEEIIKEFKKIKNK